MRNSYSAFDPLDQDRIPAGDESRRTEGTLLDFLDLPPPPELQPLEPPPLRPDHFRSIGKIRFATDSAWCVCPRDYNIVGPACFWVPCAECRVVDWGDYEFLALEIPVRLARACGFFAETTVKER
jgi:hypothetical protein